MTATVGDGAAEGAAPARRARWMRYWPVYPAMLFLGFFFVYPVVQLLGLSIIDNQGALTAEHYTRLFDKTIYGQVLWITLKVAAWTTLLAIIAGYPVAYLLATVKGSLRNTLLVWVLMPFWTSFLVRTFAWIVLLGRRGAINDFLTSFDLVDVPLRLIYNFPGVMIGMVHALMPLCVLTMLSVMENIDANLPKAAATLGARGGQSFWRIYFPLSLPGVGAGALLVFITALGFFITPQLLGGAREQMIVQVIIFQIQEVLNWAFAGAVSVLLLITVLIIFYLYDRLLGLSTLAGDTVGSQAATERNPIGKLGRWLGGYFIAFMAGLCERVGQVYELVFPAKADKPRPPISRYVLWFGAVLVIIFLAVPAFFVIPVSFTEATFLTWPPKGFSLQWYELVFETPEWIAAIGRSLAVATLASGLGMLLGVPVAFLLARRQFFGKSTLFAFLVSPIIIPHIITAVGLFYLYAKIGLVGTTLGLILGHTVLAVPYVVVTVMAVLKNYDQRLDQAAWTLGASKLRTLWHVTFPIIRAGLIAAFMFAFIISLDELTIALFVTGGEVTTLPKKMWDDAILQVSPSLAAVATLMLIFMTAIILVSEYLRRRATGKAGG